jgi:hypothetical protein
MVNGTLRFLNLVSENIQKRSAPIITTSEANHPPKAKRTHHRSPLEQYILVSYTAPHD